MKFASTEEPARKDSMPRFKIYTLHNIIPRNSLTSLRALLAEVYTPVPAEGGILSKLHSVCLEQLWLWRKRTSPDFQAVCISLVHRYHLDKPRFC